MKKVLSTLLIFGFLASLPLTRSGLVASIKENLKTEDPTYLVVGLDDAASNTDFLMLAHYNSTDNSLYFVQVPRDTYCKYGGSEGKINRIFSSLVSSGKTSSEAMDLLQLFICESFGVKIDGYVAYTVDAFVRLVDNIGGVVIDMPYSIAVKGASGETVLQLSEGANKLSGREASVFVRHRSSYKTQDLGRLDAQKLFLAAFIDSFRREFSLETSIRLLLDGGEGVITNLKVGDFINLLLKNKGRIASVSLNAATAPGRPVLLNGKISYYSLCKNACNNLLTDIGIKSDGVFDSRMLFRCSEVFDFYSVYDSMTIDYKLLSEDRLRTVLPG